MTSDELAFCYPYPVAIFSCHLVCLHFFVFWQMGRLLVGHFFTFLVKGVYMKRLLCMRRFGDQCSKTFKVNLACCLFVFDFLLYHLVVALSFSVLSF